ncbi:SGNH/GDSL hydrolase family protein [Actinomadura rupiterrae]|uniref:SGNH/GDSL hydrolase family protein n=1 Tax=Actinomadura rupiterrae TaxID=559627 RepID=UPI0020A51A71|nr:SGNH/GDSL hydrolase family protein [Actinomadura rupiterrae]MCP2338167.1 lysophospholipase L1-like esterase [Actinomadura rupiterrae]
MRARIGDRGLAVALLLVLLAVAIVPLVALPAVRCEAFGAGCRAPLPGIQAQAAARDRGQPLSPVAAATRGSYVALGDSYSAGVGAEATLADQNPLSQCHRTSKAYYHTVAKTFRFAGGSSFWACSGATTRDVRKGRGGEPSQLNRVDGNTTLVTISVGGNDIGFAKIMAGCVVKLPWSRGCEKQGGDIAERMAGLRESLPELVRQITTRAPRARVIMMGYPRPFSEVSVTGGDNLTLDDQRWLNGRARDLNELIRQTATEADQHLAAAHAPGSVEFVDAYSAFSGHEAGSADPYMNGLSVNLSALAAEPRSYHPTAKGQDALAKLFVDQINKGPGRPLNQTG